jgi:hypothetical protein
VASGIRRRAALQAESGWTSVDFALYFYRYNECGRCRMDMECQAFTEGEVARDGSIALGFVDEAGNTVKVRVSINQAGALAMTLPELVATALRNRHGNQKVRFAYPLTSWRVEQSSDLDTGMMTLYAPDGFNVCFSMGRDLQNKLGETLVTDEFSSLAAPTN